MQKISPDQISAFENKEQSRANALSVQWYKNWGNRLPQKNDEFVYSLLANAKETAKILGILDNEVHRVRRLMVFHAVLPDPTDTQWLSGVDIIFDEPINETALKHLVQLSRQTE
ncbi:MAG: hypothetical protein HKN36_09310 [Hellea sp.]|nr:hypothetical protein [Hellea sp.]